MADYAIHDTTLTGISNVIRKKDGTQALIDPADYADRINLMGMLEQKSISSQYACIFSDGADDVPMVSWTIHTTDFWQKYACRMGKNLAYTAGRDTTNGYRDDYGVEPWSGIDTAQTGFFCTEFIPVPEGATLTLSGFDNSQYDWSHGSAVGFAIYDGRKQFLAAGNNYDPYYTVPMTFTIPHMGAFVRLSIDKTQPDVMLEIGSSASTFVAAKEPVCIALPMNHENIDSDTTADLFAGTGELHGGTPFTFTPITMNTMDGYNIIFCSGATSNITYRSSGTATPIPPTLVSKTINANGTYEAEDDDADGYDEVTVNVPPYSFMPTWTETKLVDNTSLASSITFASDYHNYQMLRFVIYNSSTQIYDSIFVLPSGIDKAFTYSSNKFCINQQITGYTNQYVTYQEDSLLSWSRTGNRNCNVYEVYGMTFTNATMTAEVIYSRDALTSGNVTPTPPTGKTFFDYDAIIYMFNTTDVNITAFSKWWITKPKLSLFTDSVGYGIPLFAYNAGKPVVFTGTSIGTYNFFYVVGLNFTAT